MPDEEPDQTEDTRIRHKRILGLAINREFDQVAFVASFECGQLSQEEIIEGFQHLIEYDSIWDLPAIFGHTAVDFVEQGICKDTHGTLFQKHPELQRRPEYR